MLWIDASILITVIDLYELFYIVKRVNLKVFIFMVCFKKVFGGLRFGTRWVPCAWLVCTKSPGWWGNSRCNGPGNNQWDQTCFWAYAVLRIFIVDIAKVYVCIYFYGALIHIKLHWLFPYWDMSSPLHDYFYRFTKC